MCRRHLVFAVGLICFGAGVAAGGWIESGLLRFLLAAGTVLAGFAMLNPNCRHK